VNSTQGFGAFQSSSALEGATTQHSANGEQPSSLLRGMPGHGHAVQFYEDEDFLLETVIGFLRDGVFAGDRLLVVAVEAHRNRIREALGPVLKAHPRGDAALVMLDAAETLSRLMVGDTPDKARFDAFLSECIVMLGEDATPNIRGYGEMVNLLWRRGNPRAAIRLEELWNDARKEHPFALLCAYAVSAPLAPMDASHFAGVCDHHDLVLPTERFFRHEDRAARLREVSLTQHRARAHAVERARRIDLERVVEEAMEAMTRFEDDLAESNLREKAVRAKTEANDAFAELFLGVLKDGLGKPVRAMLETAQRMSSLRGDGDASLRELLSSARHVERMVGQLAEVTRVRCSGGIEVHPIDGQDIVPVVAKVVADASDASPEFTVSFRAPSACVLRTDLSRLEQVVANLVGNALVHGDAGWPVNVTIAEIGEDVSLSVQNCGEPIPPALLTMLFNPFARGARPQRGPVGLGLGLYL
jgi:signal transduction histidine kinase